MVLYFLFVPRGPCLQGTGELSPCYCIIYEMWPRLKFAYQKLAEHSCVSLEAHMKSRTNGIEGR